MTKESKPYPYISAFCICGDSGVGTLGRALHSIVFRSNGPIADEIVIGWNGKDEKALGRALWEGFGRSDLAEDPYGYEPHLDFTKTQRIYVKTNRLYEFDLRLVKFDWTGRFDTARNLTQAHCTGEWIYWFDTDDYVSDPTKDGPEDKDAIEIVERTYKMPIVGPVQPLREALEKLPYNVNCIHAPYDYAILDDGSVAIRQRVRRMLRRSANWVWRSFSGVHEIPYPASSVGECAIYTARLLHRHRPAVVATDRLQRNAKIVEAMQAPDVAKYADARHHYDIASVHIGQADFQKAEAAITKAIDAARNPEDAYRYLLIRYSVVATEGRLKEALRDVVDASTIFPDREEAFFAMSECCYLLGNPKACIKYYEIGAACQLQPVALDLCVNRVVRPRANAAWAYCDLGQPERGLPIAAEAMQEYPKDELAKRAYNRCAEEVARKKGIEGLVAAVEFLMSRTELTAAKTLLLAMRGAVSLRGVAQDSRFQLMETRIDNALNALGSVTSECPEADRVVRTYPKGSPPMDALTFQTPGNRLVAMDQQPDGSTRVTLQPTKKIPITFFCPGNALIWNPTFPEVHGLGGSETSFILLARELAKRGHPVTLYCNDGSYGGNLHEGVVWLSVNAFDDARVEGVLVSCRSPQVVRSLSLKAPTYCWHQDNGYSNEYSWCKSVDAKLTGNFYVSKWAMDGLLTELGDGTKPTDAALLKRQHVLGNPIRDEWCWARQPRDARPERNPRRAVYASDPMRGLDTLMNVWPMVREAVPDAELYVYTDFTLTMSRMGLGSEQETPKARQMVEELQTRLSNTPGVAFRGRVGQTQLSKEMFEASIYAYPGGQMPEGFGVSLVQAAAAGMRVLGPLDGALPEVLDGAAFVPPLRNDDDARKFVTVLIAMLKGDVSYEQREHISAGVWERHGIDKVADRFEAVLKRDGLA